MVLIFLEHALCASSSEEDWIGHWNGLDSTLGDGDDEKETNNVGWMSLSFKDKRKHFEEMNEWVNDWQLEWTKKNKTKQSN